MNPNWLSAAAELPASISAFAVVAAIGAIATGVVLVRQTSPRTRIDPERIARRRERSSRAAH
ncbi:hypothetical protein [Agrococcus baldri]|uniref:Uncharacterized protein n=1 Tax=Agrococcus baldri TaxID=153730 RepID=A0AA87RIL8_9MICO|nr:hypothetical protein [Agrococcus baldri]GEK81114.1 hypothetical protein ABA31_24650 [Agrococcus baldri]